jgi:diamine N-acetyltransferase
MAVTLRPIAPDNWRACIQLNTTEVPRHFVASMVYSLTQAYVEPWWTPLAIYADETPVGFVMYRQLPGTDITWIQRIMIDARYQTKGYGRAAMEAVIARIRQQEGGREIRLSYYPDNTVAAHLYEYLGFRPTGELQDGEIVVRLAVSEELR